MWAALAALGHWFQFDHKAALMKVIHIDDGPRADQLAGLTGRAFLTCLDFVERIGWLKSDSEILDLGLVMSIWLDWSASLRSYGIEDTAWRKNVVGYAKKAGIDLKRAGCSAAGQAMRGLEGTAALKGQAKAGRWNWPSSVSVAECCSALGFADIACSLRKTRPAMASGTTPSSRITCRASTLRSGLVA